MTSRIPFIVTMVLGLSGLGVARADPAGVVELPEDATGEVMLVRLAEAIPRADLCVWRAEGRGWRVKVGKQALEGRLVCDAKVIGPIVAGRTRSSRVKLVQRDVGMTAALDTYGARGEFYPRVKEKTLGLDGAAAELWALFKEPEQFVVLPGHAMYEPEKEVEWSCRSIEPFKPEEIVQTVGTARERMEHCWKRGAAESAFTFDLVTDRFGAVLPKVVASLRKEPSTANCLASALAGIRFDEARARCHQLHFQWPVTSKAPAKAPRP